MRRWGTTILGAIAALYLASGPALPAPDHDSADLKLALSLSEDEIDDVSPPAEPPGLPAEANSPAATALPPVEYDVSKLPSPVRRLREQILDAAVTGDIEKLRPIFEANGEPPALAVSELETDDPIEHLKSLAGDPEGREILAILIEVLNAGFVHVDEGTPDEMYVWPYFARYPFDKLSGPQTVELFKLLTAGDYDDMKVFGTYLFYRVGISPDGVWHYFTAGD